MAIQNFRNIDNILKKRVAEIHVKIMLDIDRRVVFETPVDTGRARGNWIFSVGTPSRAKFKSISKGSNESKIKLLKKPERTFLSNNLDYIQRLNDGYSKQAARKYVQNAVKIVVRKYSKKIGNI